MALVCASLGANVEINCTNEPVPGLNNFAYLYNKDDIASYTASGTAGSISAIVKKTTVGLRSYKYTGGNETLNTLYSLVTGGVLNGFQHQFTLIYPNDDEVALDELKKLANAKVVGVTNKNGADGFGTFRVQGRAQGLVMTGLEGDDSNQDRDGLPFVTLTTPEGFKEPRPPIHLLNTDYPTTLGDLETALTPNV